MSAPRLVVPGVTYLLTRRCSRRLLLLRPSPEINQIFKFCLAQAAAKTGMLIHAFCMLSNHYHIVATDPRGNLPVFMHWLNEYVAKCVNVKLGRWESFWAPGSYSAVALGDDEAILDRLVYTYVNPVKAGLVPNHAEWPGAHSVPSDMLGMEEIVPRPKGFFRNRGPVPKTAVLRVVAPPSLEDDLAHCLTVIREQVRVCEAEIRSELAAEGRTFLGRRRVLQQSPTSRPRNPEPRHTLNPRVAARDKWRRIESLQRLKSFLNEYRVAWRAFVEGNRSVIFPFGTYGMRVRFGVCCNDP